MRSHSAAYLYPSAIAITAVLMISLPSCQGRRRAASTTRTRNSDQQEFVISVAGDGNLPFSGSYRVFRQDGTTLYNVDGTTPAEFRARGAIVSVAIQKRRAQGELEIRIHRAECDPAREQCVTLGRASFFLVAQGSTVEPFGMLMASSQPDSVLHGAVPGPVSPLRRMRVIPPAPR